MFDVVIIGAGVTGSAIAREVSRYKLNRCVIEKEEDVCNETSKANSAIIHAGFDAVPGTMKAKLNVMGNAMMDTIAEELDIPFKRNGSLVVCTKEQDPEGLQVLMERGKKNGVPGLQILDREALIEKTGEGFRVQVHHADTGVDETIETKLIINAAGVYADEINNQLSDRKLHITARKGEYMLLDKTVGDYVKSTIFQLPSKMGKGVLVTPTVHGNLLVGPTAVNVEDKGAVNTTMDGLDQIARVSSHSVKNVPLRQVITSFAGLRAHEDGDDFVIGESADVKGLINAAGIESPGLSSAPAIGVTVAELVRDLLNAEEKSDFNPVRHGILDPDTLSLEERNQLIKETPAYGNIICRCEMITEGEILDAIHRPLGARSLDGVKRRTRAGMGRCQSGFCSPKVMEILEREVPMPVDQIGKNGVGSEFIVGENKELEDE